MTQSCHQAGVYPVRSDRSLCAPLAGEADAHKPQVLH